MMTNSSRRNFLIASGVGAAAVGVGATLPATATAKTTAATAKGSSAKPASTPLDAEPLIAQIADPATGELTLLVGERELVIHDPDLVGRITTAAKET